MMNEAERTTNAMHSRLIGYEFVGRLKGMSREEIDNWWGKNEADRVADEIRRGKHR
jgi:hypothetical protein